MNSSRPLAQRKTNVIIAAQQTLLVLATLITTVLGTFVLFTLGVRLVYAQHALPSVTAVGLDLSGMSQAEIEIALGDALSYPQSGRIVLQDGDQQWVARPADLGVLVDVPEMARRALAVGRRGGLSERLTEQFEAWYGGHSLVPIVIFDQRTAAGYLQELAAQIDRPTLEARLEIDGVEVLAYPGQIGRRLDIPATLAALTPTVSMMHGGAIPLVIEEESPLVLDASLQAEAARQILSQPLSLTVDGADGWVIDPVKLAEMIQFEIVQTETEARYQVGLDPLALENALEPLAPDLERTPENARFIFNDETRELDLLQSAVIGRRLNLGETIKAINQALADGQHKTSLVFDTTDPAVTDDATAAELGISENVVAVSTYFAGSSPERIHNIKTAAAAFHGLLVAPGEMLSMAEVLGDISLDKGYAEALIIYGNRTIKGVGGGVCQVSTTLYRAAFEAGFPIAERHPHAYRVLYYEQGPRSPGPGMDATVFVPLVDFKFVNDTPSWLLLETYIYGNQLLWKFYSTSDGRSVQWTSSGPKNVVEAPKPLYRENPELQKGEIKQLDFEADGMDVVVERIVARNGQILHDDTFKTHYLPWRAIYEYGPGTKLPKGAKTE